MKVDEIKHKSKPLDETVAVEKILGKKVLASDGNKIGTIGHIQIHPTDLSIEGIWVCGAFVCRQYIGRDYIDSLSENGAVLSIVPANQMESMYVYDSTGMEIGKVKAVNRSKKTNNMLSLVVNAKGSRDDLIIPKSAIKEIGDNIILSNKLR